MVPDEPALHDYASGPVTRAVRSGIMPVVYIGPRYTRGDHDVLMSHVCGNPCKTRCRWNTYIADTVNTLNKRAVTDAVSPCGERIPLEVRLTASF